MKMTYISFYQFNDASFGKNDLKKLVDNVFKEMGTNEVLIIIVLKDKPGSSIKKEIKLPKYENTELIHKKSFKI